MTIVEFAYLSLPKPTTSSTPQLLKNLVTVTNVIQASSNLPTRFFLSTTNNAVMFVIGGWPSQSAHQDGFDGSAEQATLFPLIEGMMEIDWMEYLDTRHSTIPADKAVLVAVVLRCGVRSEWEKRKIMDRLGELVHKLVGNDEVPMVDAWNLKKGKQKDEEDVLVCFSGWDDEKAAKLFGESVRANRLPEWVKKPDVYHMRRAKLG